MQWSKHHAHKETRLLSKNDGRICWGLRAIPSHRESSLPPTYGLLSWYSVDLELHTVGRGRPWNLLSSDTGIRNGFQLQTGSDIYWRPNCCLIAPDLCPIDLRYLFKWMCRKTNAPCLLAAATATATAAGVLLISRNDAIWFLNTFPIVSNLDTDFNQVDLIGRFSVN